ncbi:hypothetical protein MTR_2g064025 [Medicago truncatula]|uniref:Uncharacterized protein n=1 Tax=Medicago truncatula TaxID=3880 RepID=A0A072V8S8_MEDTR|nr:hypothetical protein MTR_2g064025 [Medicago truncatula]
MEEENAQLRTELASLREELAKANDTMTALLAAQEQSATAIPIATSVIPTASTDARFVMPTGFPYGLPPFFTPSTAAGVSGTVNNGQIPGTNPVSVNTTLPQTTATLDQLSYRGTPLGRSTFLVKAFDGSRKNILGEIDLPITVCPETFLITFQVMDINAAQLPPSYPHAQYSQHPFFPPFYHQYPLPSGQPQVPVNAVVQRMQQQPPAQQRQQQQARPTFPPIPMLYAELLPTLLLKGHCTTRQGKPPPDPSPPKFRSDLKCDFHQGALGHDVEGCYALRYIVKKLIDQGKLTFENNVPHVLDNPLPNHAVVNMIEVYEEAPRPDVCNIATPLVPLHIKLCQASLFDHDHASCPECFHNPWGCYVVQNDIQSLMNDNYLTVNDIQEGQAAGWGKLIQLLENKHKEGLGYSPTSGVSTGTFYSAGFINAITEKTTGFDPRPMFVIPGGIARNWDAIIIPSIMHVSE